MRIQVKAADHTYAVGKEEMLFIRCECETADACGLLIDNRTAQFILFVSAERIGKKHSDPVVIDRRIPAFH